MVPSHMHILWLTNRPHSTCSQSRIPRCTSQEHLYQRVPNIQGQHHGGVYVSPIRFASSPSSTPCDRRQRSKILFWNYLNLTSTEKVQSCKYIQILADPFLVSSKPFIWVGLLFENYLILLKAPPPSTPSLKKSSVKISFRNSFPHHTPKLCAWTSLEEAFVERENSWPITSWHVRLLSPRIQPITKHHVLLLGFAITTQKPTEICQVSCKKPITH